MIVGPVAKRKALTTVITTGSVFYKGTVCNSTHIITRSSVTAKCSRVYSDFMPLSPVFHSINSPDNSPFSHSALPVLLTYIYMCVYVCVFVCMYVYIVMDR